jgi:hypothetical protein
MTLSFKQIFALLAAGISIFNIGLYIRTTLLGKTRPHAFSWLLWALVMGIVFVAQYSNRAGAGALQTLIAASLCFVVGILALFRGERKGTRSDWIAILIALSVVPLWALTDNALLAVIILSSIDCLGFYPTFRKAWHKPQEESSAWAWRAIVSFSCAILALENYSWTTCLYPGVMVAAHASFGVMLMWRRSQIAKKSLI